MINQIKFGFLVIGTGLLMLPATTQAAISCQTPITVSFSFAVQGGELGVEIKANAEINGDIYSNAKVQGELFAKVNGNVTAVGEISGLFVSGAEISGAPPHPLPPLNVAEWENAAALGGIRSADVVIPVNSSGNLLGPLKIEGNLIIEENSETIIQGNLFVTGNIFVRNNAQLRLASSFGSTGTVIIALGNIQIAGNAKVDGTSNGGFLLMASPYGGKDYAINLQPNFNSRSTVFYALEGGLLIGENSKVIAAYGKNVAIRENAQVNFVEMLKFATFICPPPQPPPKTIPQIALKKTPSALTVAPGEKLSYQIHLENQGTATATALILSDDLDQNLTFLASNPLPTSTSTSLITWDIGDLSPLLTFLVNLEVMVKSTTTPGTIIRNMVLVTGPNISPTEATSTPVTVGQVQEAPPASSGGGSGGGGGGSGPSHEASLVFTSVPEKTVGSNFEEQITIVNRGLPTLAEGRLEITFPEEIRLATSTPEFRSYANNQAVWPTPRITEQNSHTVNLTVVPQKSGSSLITTARLIINEREVAFTNTSENVGQVASVLEKPPPPKERDAAGAKTLPRTGASPFPLFFLPFMAWALCLFFKARPGMIKG